MLPIDLLSLPTLQFLHVTPSPCATVNRSQAGRQRLKGLNYVYDVIEADSFSHVVYRRNTQHNAYGCINVIGKNMSDTDACIFIVQYGEEINLLN